MQIQKPWHLLLLWLNFHPVHYGYSPKLGFALGVSPTKTEGFQWGDCHRATSFYQEVPNDYGTYHRMSLSDTRVCTIVTGMLNSINFIFQLPCYRNDIHVTWQMTLFSVFTLYFLWITLSVIITRTSLQKSTGLLNPSSIIELFSWKSIIFLFAFYTSKVQ